MIVVDRPQALIFDLDGTIVDTETPEFEGIKAAWAELGLQYTLTHYEHVVGTVSRGNAWLDELAEAYGRPIDVAAAEATRGRVHRELTARLEPRPGIIHLIEQAAAAGVPMAIASNSPQWWVEARLDALDLHRHMPVQISIDTASRPKPDPAPFAEACAALGADPHMSVAFEDSITGVASATAAGLFTVACAGPLSLTHDLSAADVVIDSHEEISLSDLGEALAARRRSTPSPRR